MTFRLLCWTVFPAAAAWGMGLAKEPKADDAKELQQLLGVWKGYAVEGKGEKPDRGPLHIQITITATTIKAINLGDENKDMGEGTYKLDASKVLKTLDATGIVLPRKKAQTFLGIYEIQGDTLRWCVDNTKQERPTEFRTGEGKYLLVLKRVK